MTECPLIYVAGPLSGDEEANTDRAIDAGDAIEAMGAEAFVPHCFVRWHSRRPKTYEAWLKKCLRIMRKCDAVYRMAGASNGADCEVSVACIYGIPVLRSLEEVKTWLSK